MNDMTALAYRIVEPFVEESLNPFEVVGRWHSQLGRISLAMRTAKDELYISAAKYLDEDLEFELTRITEDAALLLHWLDVDDAADAFLAEYERAKEKHPGMTLDSDKHTNESRFYALAEEVGEVAAALTYDNAYSTGHNSDLISEVTQVGGLALAWLSRYQDGE